MAFFLKGKFKGFYKAGTSECVKDTFRFTKAAANKVSFDMTRKDMTSYLGRLWKAETVKLTFLPLDEDNLGAGGKIEGSALVFNAQTFSF